MASAMVIPTSGGVSTTVTLRHQSRRAYVYVRQSSPKQVRHNRQGQQNQYALTERAVALGWRSERLHVIDTDLGQSGQERERAGFRELVAEVSLGHVGIVLAYEASRLARNNADWYELLDLAALVGTLIADTDGVYDPSNYNDRLLLGLRGMLSEAELHRLPLRLDAGRWRQVAEGTFRQHLPTGLVRLPTGQVVKDPDQQIQHVLEVVFERFTILGSAHKLMRSLRADGSRLPRRQTGGLHAGATLWRPPSASALLTILRNPASAGAFAYGRRRLVAGHPPGRAPVANQPMEAWTALRRDVYPAYLSWETYMANQARLAKNRSRFAWRAQGAPRSGAALLCGLAVCGRCGRPRRVRSKPGVRYRCVARRESHGMPACLHLEGRGIERAVVAACFEAIRPAELAVLEEGLAGRRRERAQRGQHHADQVKRTEYEARLAERQYRAVDPDNRLVAAELERRWELALRVLAAAREAAERFANEPPAPSLDPALADQLRDLSSRLPSLWTSGRLRPEQQKELLRSLIRRVVLNRPAPETVDVTIVWVSGATTRLTVEPTVGANGHLRDYPRLVARIRELSAAGHHDREIVARLLAAGFHSAHRVSFPLRLVRDVRKAEGIMSLYQHCRGHGRVGTDWTVSGLARELGMAKSWIYARIASGVIPATAYGATGCYRIPDDPTLIEHLRQLATVTLSRRRAI